MTKMTFYDSQTRDSQVCQVRRELSKSPQATALIAQDRRCCSIDIEDRPRQLRLWCNARCQCPSLRMPSLQPTLLAPVAPVS